MTQHHAIPPTGGTLSESDVHALADGFLSPRRAREVEAGAAAEPWAGELLATTRGQNQMLRSIGEGLGRMDSERFAPALQRNLLDVLERRRRHRRWLTGGTVAAAALSGLLVTGWTMTEGPRPAPTGRAEMPEFPFGGSFAIPTGALPAGDGMESLAWLTRQMPDEAIHLTDLEELGFQLMSGSVLKNASSPAVHLVFEDKSAQPISLYVGIVSRSTRAAFAQVPEGHLSLHWRQGRLMFALVGDVASPRLVEVMARISAGLVEANGTPATTPTGAPPTPSLPQDAEPLHKAVLPGDSGTVRAVPPGIAPGPQVPAAPTVVVPDPAEITPLAPSGKDDQKVL
jgi:anti-sigma factor RsiW